MNLVVRFQSLHMHKNDSEYRYVRLKQDMLEMERRLDALEDEIENLLTEIEHHMGSMISHIRPHSAYDRYVCIARPSPGSFG